MSKKLTKEYVETFLDPGNTIVGEYLGRKVNIKVVCEAGHERLVSPDKLLSIGRGKSCTTCSPRTYYNSKNTEVFSKEVSKYNLELLGDYVNNHTKVLIRNNACGHEYYILPNSILTKGSGAVCRICTPAHKKPLDILDSQLSKLNLVREGEYLGALIRIPVRNTVCNHTYTVEPASLELRPPKCPECTPNPNALDQETVDIRLAEYGIFRLENYTRSSDTLKVSAMCGHSWNIIPINLFCYGSGGKCPKCFPKNISELETNLYKFISSIYSGDIITSDRSILKGKELDIVLPDLGLAFEFNGTYWHSEKFKDSSFHIDKTTGVESIGFKLIHVDEHEWVNKPHIVKSRIRALLNSTYKIFARTTQVRKITFPKAFLAENHLQGAGAPSPYNYGLFLQDELVAVMTFGTPRFSKGQDYELIRYCTLNDVTVVGGPSKLLKAFTKEFPNSSIISYSDKRWSQGNLYKTLGFEYSHTSTPGYRYVRAHHVLTRYQCQKHLLKDLFPEYYNPELTESEIMRLAGYLRSYDCGSDVWILPSSKTI